MAPVYRITSPVIIANLPISVDTNFFSTPPTILTDALKPGGGGIMRVWFAVTTAGNADTAIKVIKTNPAGTTPLENESAFVNADNDFIIKSKGIYWFDVSILEGVTVQLQSANSPDGSITGVSITTIDLLDFQKIIAGA